MTRPTPDQEKWDARYEGRRKQGHRLQPSPFLCSLHDLLPPQGRALDMAGGAGRNSIWLAHRGLSVTNVDVSEVGLQLTQERAHQEGVCIGTLHRDITAVDPPAGPWDLILDFHFLWRPLFSLFPRLLSPHGLLVFCQPTAKNLERHPRPSARYLLEDGELLTLLPPELCVVQYQEDWSPQGRHEARLVARRSS